MLVASASCGNFISVPRFSQWAKVALRAMSVPILEFLKMAKGWELPSSKFSEITKIYWICVMSCDHYVSDMIIEIITITKSCVGHKAEGHSKSSTPDLQTAYNSLYVLIDGKQLPVVDYSSPTFSCGAVVFFSHLHQIESGQNLNVCNHKPQSHFTIYSFSK